MIPGIDLRHRLDPGAKGWGQYQQIYRDRDSKTMILNHFKITPFRILMKNSKSLKICLIV